ncbi:MAG: toll/interleukin-1 receptor domain-containing protein [Novosphingobium sp.]
MRIKSDEDLKSWLADKPSELSAALASRIALRILPFGITLFERANLHLKVRNRLILAMLRNIVISRSAQYYPDREIAEAVKANAARASSALERATVDPRTSAAVRAISATRAVAAESAAFNAAVATGENSKLDHSASMVWDQISGDCAEWDIGNQTIGTFLACPLSMSGSFDPFGPLERPLFAESQIEKGDWSNWIAWYDLKLKGSSSEWGLPPEQDAEMARRLIEADENFWKRGEENPAWLNAELGRWLEELRTPVEFAASPQRYFISYASADEAMAKEVAEVLAGAGLDSFAMFKDIGPGSNFVVEMNRGLAESGHFIALYSDAYFGSDHFQAEWATAYNRDPSGKRTQIRAFLLEPCELTPLARQVVYKQLHQLDKAERKLAILDWLRWEPAKRSPGEVLKLAGEMVSPQPQISASGKITVAPNPAFDVASNPQDLIDPGRQLRVLLHTTLPMLDGNQFKFLRNNFDACHDELTAHGRNSSWGMLDRLMRNAQTSYRSTDPREFDPGLIAQIDDIFSLFAKCMTALEKADERFRELHGIEIDEVVGGNAISEPVGDFEKAAGLLAAAELTEPSFDQAMEQLVELGREQEYPPPPTPSVPSEAVSGRKAWWIGALGIAKETWNLLGSTASIASHPAAKAAVEVLGKAIAKLLELLR